MNRFDMPQIKIPSMSENYTDAVVKKIRGMEAALKPDEVLNVYCETADGRMRVGSLQLTDSTIVLAHGVDDNDVPTCLISTSFALQLTCKITKAAPNTKRMAIGFDLPPKAPKRVARPSAKANLFDPWRDSRRPGG